MTIKPTDKPEKPIDLRGRINATLAEIDATLAEAKRIEADEQEDGDGDGPWTERNPNWWKE